VEMWNFEVDVERELLEISFISG